MWHIILDSEKERDKHRKNTRSGVGNLLLDGSSAQEPVYVHSLLLSISPYSSSSLCKCQKMKRFRSEWVWSKEEPSEGDESVMHRY
jgi:hypothetical protein